MFPSIYSPKLFIIPATLNAVLVSATLPAFARRKAVERATF